MDELNKKLAEAKEYLKNGYIDIGLWQRLLREQRVYLLGESFKIRQALKDIQAELNTLSVKEANEQRR